MGKYYYIMLSDLIRSLFLIFKFNANRSSFTKYFFNFNFFYKDDTDSIEIVDIWSAVN